MKALNKMTLFTKMKDWIKWYASDEMEQAILNERGSNCIKLDEATAT